MLLLLPLAIGLAHAGPEIFLGGDATGTTGNLGVENLLTEGTGAGGLDVLFQWERTDLVARGGVAIPVTQSSEPLDFATSIANQSIETANAGFVLDHHGLEEKFRPEFTPSLFASSMTWETSAVKGTLQLVGLDAPAAVRLTAPVANTDVSFALDLGLSGRIALADDARLIPEALGLVGRQALLAVGGFEGRFSIRSNGIKLYIDAGAHSTSAGTSIPGLTNFHLNLGTNALAKFTQLVEG